MTDEQERLRDLMREWIDAEHEYRECVRTTDCDAGYFCYELKERSNEAAVAFWSAFDTYVAAVVRSSAAPEKASA